MNIHIAIADRNEEYRKRLAEGLLQYDELTIHQCTSARDLQDAMAKGGIDVVLFDPDISPERLAFRDVKLPVCLYSDDACNGSLYADCAKVLKYQRISSIYKEVVREYADKAGYSADFDHSQGTSLIAVYSPAGGSGKTTAALAIASRAAGMRKNVLFLSVEQLSSSFCLNPRMEDGLTALVEGAGDPHVNFELKLKGLMKQGINGMLYIEGFDKIVDYDAVDAGEITEVLTKIKRCGISDVIVVDMESNLDILGKAVLAQADRVVVVEKPGELPSMKMKLFVQQALAAENREKMVRVCNFAESGSVFLTELPFPTAGTIHNYGNLQLKNVIQAINDNNEVNVEKILGR